MRHLDIYFLLKLLFIYIDVTEPAELHSIGGTFWTLHCLSGHVQMAVCTALEHKWRSLELNSLINPHPGKQ